MLKKTILLTALIGTLTAAMGASAATFFSHEADWKTSVSGLVTAEGFEDSHLAPGLTSINSKGVGRIGLDNTQWWLNGGADITDGTVDLGDTPTQGQWQDVLTKDGNSSTTISFTQAVSSFGAQFDLLPASIGTGIWMTFQHEGKILAEQEVYFGSGTSGKGFWGVVFTDQVFDEIIMTAGKQPALKETFAMNYMMYDSLPLTARSTGQDDSIATPLPGAIWMFVSALVGMTFVRRRPRTKRAHA